MRIFLPVLFSVLVTATQGLTQEPFNLVNPLTPQAPPWLEGFQVRWFVRIAGDAYTQTARTVLVSLPTGGWLKPDASDLEVQAGTGKLLPFIVVSHDPTGETVIQFQRNGADPWYWVYGQNPKAPPRPAQARVDPIFHEGLTLELRDWAGDDLTTWARVRAGLDKSTRVIGNAIVGEVIQKCNPAHPDQQHKFAASYRGYLDIKKAGTYRFLVNADDASFLFIDGFKVFERPGVNARLGKVTLKDLDKLCGTVDLKEGVHSMEVHHVVGANPTAEGVCSLQWSPPGQTKFTYLLSKELKHPLYARTAGIQRLGRESAGVFAYGIDDCLETNGLKLFLVRFEVQGDVKAGDTFTWDFGDGTTGTGRSVRHVYFREKDYTVTLQPGASAAPFRRTVYPWPEPGDPSPLSLGLAVKTLETMEWKKLGPISIREIFAFLIQCDQPNRWRLLDQVAQHLLEQKDDNLEFRSQLYAARLEALAHLGQPADGLKLAEKVMPEFARTPVLQVRVQLAVAGIYHDILKDGKAASKIYKTILADHRRTEHPFLRMTAIRWGDLFSEAGDLARANETYRIAATLGGEQFEATAQTEASTRGALLRIADQKLKSGDIHQTRQLLEKIELHYPGQRLDGLYCYLRAEADRRAGRYENALRHYEMLLKLPQWAGYRDRAQLGIAEVYFRRQELDKARQWVGNVKEAFPKFYAKEKVADLENMIGARIDRVKTARAEGNPDAAFFKGYRTGFEPDEVESFGKPTFPVVAAPGMLGQHVALIETYPQDATMVTYLRPGFKNLTPGGTYWIEIWYKDIFRPIPSGGPTQVPFLHVYLAAEKSPLPEVLAGANQHRNSHEWHKLGFKLKVPLAQDYLLKVYFYNQTGIILYDDLSIQPVSDRQVDSLLGFYEGPKTP